MKHAWANPKIIIGNTATGDYYYPRPQIEANIWEETQKGNHVLLAAPRRVGKSSVMQAMLENCPEDTRCIFKNIQGVQSETEFYQQFFESIVQGLDKFAKGKKWLADFFKDIIIEEISLDGTVKFGEKKSVQYVEEINKLLPKIGQQEVKIVLLLDELPEVLNNLYKNNRRDEASSILDRLRQWRQNPAIRQHFSIVLAGSVGIHHIVKAIEGRTADINDFGVVPFEALTNAEAADYVEWATKDASVQYEEHTLRHLLSKINHFIPYFINLMLDEINKMARKVNNPVINEQNIDSAFDSIIKNNDHFKEWKNRLFDYFSVEEAGFLNDTLIYIAHRERINQRQLYDLALKHNKRDVYMGLLRGLEQDGYITEQGDHFIFVSPFLQAFWKRDNPVFDHE
ncbi:MAG: AAA-like domain-containing protein [Saprospiraceae bacterium]|nr:AAA-like domain-containing protein [Saprospiraceae bacterium]